MDYGLSQVIEGQWGFLWIIDYHGRGLLWHIVEYRGFLNMHHHGIAWITRYAPQDSDDT